MGRDNLWRNILSSEAYTLWLEILQLWENNKILSAVVISDEECDAKHPVDIPYLWWAVKTTLHFIENTRFGSAASHLFFSCLIHALLL
jgi:hypothetical protein